MTSRIKTNAFSHQSHTFACTFDPSFQMHDSRILRIAALGHCNKCTCPHFTQCLHIEILMLPALAGCKFLDILAIKRRAQFVGWQYCELPGEQIAFRFGMKQREIVRVLISMQHDSGERLPARVFLARFSRWQNWTVDPGGIHRQLRKWPPLTVAAINRKMYF